MKMGRSEGWRGAIDPQSQSSGFHVSRCQVSAIGSAWKMSLCSAVMEQHRFRSVCASSGRTERHWFLTTMTEAVKSAFCSHLCRNWTAFLLIMHGPKWHWALNFRAVLFLGRLWFFLSRTSSWFLSECYFIWECRDTCWWQSALQWVDLYWKSLNHWLLMTSEFSGQSVPIRCTVTVTCAGCRTGSRLDTKSPASPAVLVLRAWRANFCWLHLQRNLNVQVSYCVQRRNFILDWSLVPVKKKNEI